MLKITKAKLLEYYSFALLAGSLLGVHIIALNLGIVQISPYRIFLLLAPFFILNVKREAVRRHSRGINHSYFTLLLFWCIYSVIPLLWVEDVGGWVQMFAFLFTGLITTWFIGWHLQTTNDIIKALKIVEMFAVFFAVLAFYEIITGKYLFILDKSLDYFQDRSMLFSTLGYRMPIVVFINPNNYGLFLLFAITASFALSQVKKRRVSRMLSMIFVFIFVFLLVATQSRSAFIGLVIAVAVFCIKTVAKKRPVQGLIILVVVTVLALSIITDYAYLFQSLVTVDMSNGSDAIRMNLIKNGFRFLADSFLLGVGMGNIEYHMANHSIYNTAGITNIHNFWMEILVSSGVVVFTAYGIIYIKNIIRLNTLASQKTTHEESTLALCFLSVLVGLVVASVGASSVMQNEWFWSFMAIIMTFINLFSRRSYNQLS